MLEGFGLLHPSILQEDPMAPRQASPTWLLIVLCAAALPTALSVVMLGPLLVALAHEFQTSVAVVGQLAAATAITWGITAPLAGPVSDAYGRRLMLLTGLLLMAWGILGSILAWNYNALLAFRLLTGVGAALVPPNGIAMIADVFPPEERGQAIGWVVSASGVGVALGVPLVAGLLGAGGWKLPFAVVGAASMGIWLLLWVWCPRRPQQPSQALACGTAGLARISSVVTPAWLLEWAGGSRTTASGLFAVSNQLGVLGGASLGGLMLALGGFPLVGLFCLGVAVIAAVVIRLKVRESPASLVHS
jgi:predicted MFS family arabinose efflux permease